MATRTRQPVCPWCDQDLDRGREPHFVTPFQQVPDKEPNPSTPLPKAVCGPGCEARPVNAVVYAL